MKLFVLMRSFLSKLLFAFDMATGRYGSSAVILCYHSFASNASRYAVKLNVFKEQIKRVKKYADFVKIEDLSLRTTTKRAKVALTIDDGLSSVMNILPFTTANKIPVTLFVLASPEKANRKELDTDEKLLTWSQIRQLHQAGWKIGCHSATHTDFSNMSDSEIKAEVIESKKLLEKKLGVTIDSIAYPKGSYSKKIIKAVKEAGYTYGFAIEAGVVNQSTKVYEMPRTIIDSTHRPSELPAILTPSWLMFRDYTNKFKLWERFLS